MQKLIPTRIDFKHQVDTPQDAAGHIKATISGDSLTFIVTNGELLLGSSQGVYFMEFDGPRQRTFYVKVISD
ncbi:YjbQ family protein [Lacticaseibacillus paracasei]